MARSSASPPPSDLTIRVLHHPSRAKLLPRLLPRLGQHAELVPDTTHPWSGMKDVLSREVGTPHLLVIQDDSIPCQNFSRAVRNVIQEAPNRLIALFHARSKPAGSAVPVLLAEEGTFIELRLAKGSDWVPTVALVWPRALLGHWQKYRWAGSRNQRGDDLPVGQFARDHGGCLACVPSIVQHPDDTPSLWFTKRERYGRDPTRLAARYSETGAPWA
jgi:hypothetical protein